MGSVAMHDGQGVPMHLTCLKRLVIVDARHVHVGHTTVFEFVESVVKIPTQCLFHPVRGVQRSSRAFGGN